MARSLRGSLNSYQPTLHAANRMKQRRFSPNDFISINLHLTERCDMSCRVCFARYGHGAELGADAWHRCMAVIDEETAAINRRKVNFVGGEPTLLPFLGDMIADAKGRGFTTGIVTNGRTIDERFLDGNAGALDVVGVSVDSASVETNGLLGRSVRGEAWGGGDYSRLARAIRSRGYYLKVNTVVSSLNCREDLSRFIADAEPDKWKVMQCLVVKGQNDRAASIGASDEEFSGFVSRHASIACMSVETAESMRGSYVMIDPRGRPYGNAEGKAAYGEPVWEAGLLSQLDGLGYSGARAMARGADRF